MREPSFDHEIHTEAHMPSPVVQQAAQRYTEGRNGAFVRAGDNEATRDRLCPGCPGPSYCGAVAARLAVSYNSSGGIIPSKDQPTLARRGIETSPDGYTVCSERLISNVVDSIQTGAYACDPLDPLAESSRGHQAVDTLRTAVDDTMSTLNNGIRL